MSCLSANGKEIDWAEVRKGRGGKAIEFVHNDG
jgi:hypothetical protein